MRIYLLLVYHCFSIARCNVGLRYNGCGPGSVVGISINLAYKETLKPACIKHDICYNCVSSPEVC